MQYHASGGHTRAELSAATLPGVVNWESSRRRNAINIVTGHPCSCDAKRRIHAPRPWDRAVHEHPRVAAASLGSLRLCDKCLGNFRKAALRANALYNCLCKLPGIRAACQFQDSRAQSKCLVQLPHRYQGLSATIPVGNDWRIQQRSGSVTPFGAAQPKDHKWQPGYNAGGSKRYSPKLLGQTNTTACGQL